MHIDEITRPP